MELHSNARTCPASARPGRRKGSRCVKPTPALRRAKKCTRYTRAGTLTRASAKGANTVTFSGRIGRKGLRPDRYCARQDRHDSRPAS